MACPGGGGEGCTPAGLNPVPIGDGGNLAAAAGIGDADDEDGCLECKPCGITPPTPTPPGDPLATNAAPAAPVTPCRMDSEGDEPDALEMVLDLNGWTGLMCGLRIGRAPEIGEDERDDVPPPAAATAAVDDDENGLAGYGLSLAEIDDEEDEFMLSLLRR